MQNTQPSVPSSVYQIDAPPAAQTHPLQGARKASIAIIGGGIVGLTTALHLAETGVDVVVLEAREPGWGASGNNGGQLNPGLKFDPDTIEAAYGPDLGRRMIAFSYDAPNRAFALIRRLAIDCDARQNGTLRLAHSERDAAAVREIGRQCLARDMPVRVLQRDEVATATGTQRYLTALHDTRGGDVNPLSYVRGLLRAALSAGAAVHKETPVTSLRRNGSDWLLGTPSGSVVAEKVLIATNGFTDDLWPGLKQTLVPVFSSIAATQPLSPAIARQIVPLRCSVYETGRITVYYRVDAKGRLLMGGRGPMRWISRPDEISYLLRYAEVLWPSLVGTHWTHAWNSRLAITGDHWPHIHEPAESVLVYLGCNGRGVALGSALGEQLASRLLNGQKSQLDLPVSDMKAIPFHGLWPIAVQTAVLHGRIMDRLGL